MANLFNTYPALDLPTEQAPEAGVVIEETREEKTYRNFLNSLGIEPHVNYLYSDLCDGLVILQVSAIAGRNLIELDLRRIRSCTTSSDRIPSTGRRSTRHSTPSENVFKN